MLQIKHNFGSDIVIEVSHKYYNLNKLYIEDQDLFRSGTLQNCFIRVKAFDPSGQVECIDSLGDVFISQKQDVLDLIYNVVLDLRKRVDNRVLTILEANKAKLASKRNY